MVRVAEQPLYKRGYIIEAILAEGEFGVTYKARHQKLDKLVVIKTFKDSIAEQYSQQDSQQKSKKYTQLSQRFIQYGELHQRLSLKNNSHLVYVRDIFEEHGKPWLVMDFVRGESLFSLVRRRGALAEAEAVKYVQQIGKALQLIHEERLVHGSVHPTNIIIQPDGNAILMDFAIAAAIAPTVPDFDGYNERIFFNLSSKKIQNKLAIDIYNLASCLNYALTGKNNIFTLEHKQKFLSEVESHKSYVNISHNVNQAIKAVLETQSAKRPQSVHQFLELLDDSANPESRDGQLIPLEELIYADSIQSTEKSYYHIDKVKISRNYFISILSANVFLGFNLVPLLATLNPSGVLLIILINVSIWISQTKKVALALAFAGVWTLLWASTWFTTTINSPASKVLAWSGCASLITIWVLVIAFEELVKSYRKFDAYIFLLQHSGLGLIIGLLSFYFGHNILK